MRPILVMSELTGSVYIVTRYKTDPHGNIISQAKTDVTGQFQRLALAWMSRDDEADT